MWADDCDRFVHSEEAQLAETQCGAQRACCAREGGAQRFLGPLWSRKVLRA